MSWERSSSSDSRHYLQMYSKRNICFKISKSETRRSEKCVRVYSVPAHCFPSQSGHWIWSIDRLRTRIHLQNSHKNNEFGLECWSGKPCPEHGPDDFGPEKGFDVGEIISDSYFPAFMDILKQSPFGFTHFWIHPEIRCLQISDTKFQLCARFSPKTRFRLSLIQERARAYSWTSE